MVSLDYQVQYLISSHHQLQDYHSILHLIEQPEVNLLTECHEAERSKQVY